MDHTLFDQTWKTRYAEQMAVQSQLIDDIRQRHLSGETFTLLCACHDPQECHRTVLADIIEKG